MIFKNLLNYTSQLILNILNQLQKVYLNSNYYDNKISKADFKNFFYKPSPDLLSSLIKYQKKKDSIENFLTEDLWNNQNLNLKDFEKLNNFYWFFGLDLRSSKKKTQSIVSSWIKKNFKYNSKSWGFDLTSKRIIAWLSNHNLTYEESDIEYQKQFNAMIQKQTNHLICEINKPELLNKKIIGCAAIILVGLCYKNKNYLSFGLNLLKKISKNSLDSYGFPKSRNIKEIILYLKYFILIREWFKESQILIPEQIDETIYYLGQGYAFAWQNIKADILFNGNNKSNNLEFDHYLKRFGYKFKNQNREFGGYALLQNKKISLIMDIGSTPICKFTENYQAGALSFEIVSNGKKLMSNCGYYHNKNLKMSKISKSSAAHNTLFINDSSSCEFEKNNKSKLVVNNGLKIINKNIAFEKNYWKINASHNGYLKKYKSIYEREIEFYPEQSKFIGTEKILNTKVNYNIKFEIRFHFEPTIKLMKTQDNKTIFIELGEEGWKFTCDNFDINIDNGLYFGNKNSYTGNQNIFVSGISKNQNKDIRWVLTKI